MSNKNKICFICGYEFNRICNFNKHLKKKRKCPVKYLDISREQMLTDYSSIYNKYHDQYLDCVKNNVVKDKLIKCEKCHRKFNHKSNLCVHIKNHCFVIKYEEKLKKEIEDKIKQEYEEKLQKVKEEMEEKYNELKENFDEIITKFEDKLQNQTIDDISINSYGDEDLESINKNIFEEIIATEYLMIQNLVKYIHIIVKKNRNILVPSTKDRYAMVFKNKKWILVDKNKLADELIENKCKILHNMFEKFFDGTEKVNQNKVNQNKVKNILSFCEYDENERKKIKTDILLNLINEQNNVRETYEKNYGQKIKIY